MALITKAQKALKDAGFDDWGEGAEGLKEILTAMQTPVIAFANSTESLQLFLDEYFNEKSVEVDDDDD